MPAKRRSLPLAGDDTNDGGSGGSGGGGGGAAPSKKAKRTLELVASAIHAPALRVPPNPCKAIAATAQKPRFLGGVVAVQRQCLSKSDLNDLLLMQPYTAPSAPQKRAPFSMAVPFERPAKRRHKPPRPSDWLRVPRGFALGKFSASQLDAPILRPGETWEDVGGEPDFPRFVGALRPAQVPAVAHVLAKLKSFPHHGMLNAGCGIGKTTMALYVACQLKCRTLVIVPNTKLIDQWEEKARAFCPGAVVGRLQGVTNKTRTPGHFCIASMATLSMLRPDDADDQAFLEQFEFCVMDECHLGCAKERSKCMHHVRSTFVLGLSATLNRSDRLAHGIEYLLGPVLYRLSYLCSVDVQPVKFVDPGFRFVGQRWNKHECNFTATVSALSHNKKRTACVARLIKYYRAVRGRSVVVISKQVQPLEDLHAVFGPEESGLVAGTASTLAKKRRRALAMEKPILLGSEALAATGLDKEDLDLIILMSPMKGGRKEDFAADPRRQGGGATLQQAVGRVMRLNDDKEWPLCVDFFDGGPGAGPIVHGLRQTRVRWFAENKCTVLPELVMGPADGPVDMFPDAGAPPTAARVAPFPTPEALARARAQQKQAQEVKSAAEARVQTGGAADANGSGAGGDFGFF